MQALHKIFLGWYLTSPKVRGVPMDKQARQAVRDFLVRACHHVETGSHEALAERITSYGPPGVKRASVSSWIQGRNQPNAWVLFALAVDLELSLDEFALRDSGLAARVQALEKANERFHELLGRVALTLGLTESEEATQKQLTSKELRR